MLFSDKLADKILTGLVVIENRLGDKLELSLKIRSWMTKRSGIVTILFSMAAL